MGKVFIYGSLMRGHFNNERWRFSERTRFLRTGTLKGHRMYDLGDYPCIVPTGDEAHVVRGEVFEYLDEGFERTIKGFEEGVGYSEVGVLVDGEAMMTFVFPDPPVGCPIVPSGDWNDR